MSNDTANNTALLDDELSLHEPGLEALAPTLGDVAVKFLITAAIIVAVSRSTYIYSARGGKGSAFRTVMCLWCVDAFPSTLSQYLNLFSPQVARHRSPTWIMLGSIYVL